jgi:predicted RNase H-like HicB family nuclease
MTEVPAPASPSEILKPETPVVRPSTSMKGRTFHLVIEKDEDGYFVGEVPELPGCHSQANSLAELRSRMKEAIETYLEALPQPPQGPSFVEVQTIEV